MADVTNETAVSSLLLDEVVFTSLGDGEVTSDLVRQDSAGSSDKFECLDQSVLRGVEFGVDSDFADVDGAVQLRND